MENAVKSLIKGDVNVYADHICFSDDFKRDVIVGKYNSNPKDFDNCIRAGLADKFEEFRVFLLQASDHSVSFQYTSKQNSEDSHAKLSYVTILKINYPYGYPSREERAADFAFFIKKDGEWFFDMMPYAQLPDTYSLCQKSQLTNKNFLEKVGLTLAEGYATYPTAVTVNYNEEIIQVSDWAKSESDGLMNVEFSRGDKTYTFVFTSKGHSGTILTDSYDWDTLKSNISVSQKMADMLEANPVKYTDFNGKYVFSPVKRSADIWAADAYVEANLSAQRPADRRNKIGIAFNITTGTISEDSEKQAEIKAEKNEVQTAKINDYISAGLQAVISMLIFLFAGFVAMKALQKSQGISIPGRAASKVAIFAGMTWLIFSFLGTPYIMVKTLFSPEGIVPRMMGPYFWPWGLLFGSFVFPIILDLIAAAIITFLAVKILEKEGIQGKSVIKTAVALFMVVIVITLIVNNLVGTFLNVLLD